jgi:predicted kinase
MNVYLMCGLAFSGRSTIAAEIHRLRGAVVVSLDEINLERGLQGGLGIPDSEWIRTHEEAMHRLELALRAGHDVIIDDTNCFRFLRDNYRAVADRFNAETTVVFIDATLGLVVERLRSKDGDCSRAKVTEDVLMNLVGKFEPPSPDERVLFFNPDCNIQSWVNENIS